ncbi:MAG: Uma2 family endonuclease [bacterium]
MPARAVVPRYSEKEFYAARDAAPAGERWELVDGEALVTPAPHWSHQGIVVRLLEHLAPWVRAHSLGKLLTAPLDVRFEPGLIMQPDIVIVPEGHLRTMHDTVTKLLLAVETLSPSSARFDRVVKRPRYQRHRVSEYWIVDGESRLFERWQPDDDRPAIVTDNLIWKPQGASEPFLLDVASFFSEVLPSDE